MQKIIKTNPKNSSKGKSVGFTCSCFDLLHAGHILMLKDAKEQCDYLIVGLQTDPTIDRPDTKNKPIQSLEERLIQLRAVRYVDEIRIYSTESDLRDMLCEIWPSVRILGSDYITKDNFTGCGYDIPIYYHERNHNYSSSELRKKLREK
jgi:glycerol-3-phosphate cytidylyltransferase|tara:strand:+ start:323 stop:769 length:447 start_codon:yes stop_codon:yes gene_type:complete